MNLESLIEYMKIHLISLEQDLDMTTEEDMVNYYEGAIEATEHLLAMAHKED